MKNRVQKVQQKIAMRKMAALIMGSFIAIIILLHMVHDGATLLSFLSPHLK